MEKAISCTYFALELTNLGVLKQALFEKRRDEFGFVNSPPEAKESLATHSTMYLEHSKSFFFFKKKQKYDSTCDT